MDLTLLALLITAIATAVLAILTAVLAWQNRKVVSAAEQEIGEIQRDRELASQPLLSFQVLEQPGFQIVNFGRGPAINVVGVYQHGADWFRTREPVDLAPNNPVTVPATPQSDSIADPEGVVKYRLRDGRGAAVFCQDQLGHAYRFGSHKVAPDIWRPGTPAPDWMNWYLNHLP